MMLGGMLPEELAGQDLEAKVRLEERAKRRARERADGPEGQKLRRPRKEQSNFTDPDSRIMKSSWIQGYNAQVLVEAGSGVIVAQEVTPQSADSPR